MDELTAVSDNVIRFRLKPPFPLLPEALAEPYCSIMPERLAQTSAFEQVKEAIGSGPFKFIASERIPGQRVVFDKNPDYVPRPSGTPSFSAGPKAVYIDRVIWNFVQDPSTASAALAQGEVDWWENPTIDLVPQLKRNKDLVLTVKDRTGEIGTSISATSKSLPISWAGLPTRPPPRMSIAISYGWPRSGRRWEPPTSAPLHCGSSSRSH